MGSRSYFCVGSTIKWLFDYVVDNHYAQYYFSYLLLLLQITILIQNIAKKQKVSVKHGLTELAVIGIAEAAQGFAEALIEKCVFES